MGCTIATPPQPLTGCAYCKQITLFIGYAFCQVCMGAVLMIMFCFSSQSKDYHAGLCTIGWQLFIAEGVLIMVYTHCNPLQYHHRRSTHMFIQILGLSFVLSGSVLILYKINLVNASYKIHGWIGIIAFVFTLISALAGPIAALKYDMVKIVHGCLGLPTLILSTMAFFTGAMNESFKVYAGFTAMILLIILCVYFAGFLIVATIFKIVVRCQSMRKKPEVGWCTIGSSSKTQKKTEDKKGKTTPSAKESSSKASTSAKNKNLP